ncbi:MAG: GreA/GreB family elongation factor [Betaproteobacteria bacterium]
MQDSHIHLRTLTELDHIRLQNLIRRYPVEMAPGTADTLGAIIDNADLVRPDLVAADTVTMNSQVVIADSADGAQRTLTLCYPHDAEPAKGLISILSPIGTGLIGLRVGEVASWHGPDGQPASAQLQAILFQPEASGDYLT